MASLEQGNYVVDPACPTKEYNQCLSHPIMRKHKSFSGVLETRRDWADMRKRITRTLQENLWREDHEKVQCRRDDGDGGGGDYDDDDDAEDDDDDNDDYDDDYGQQSGNGKKTHII